MADLVGMGTLFTLCCGWPLAVGALGWWARGNYERWAADNQGRSLWDVWQRR